MIESKRDYYEFVEADKKALGRKNKKPRINDIIWRYEILLRKCEYYNNCKHGMFNSLIALFYKYRRYRIGLICHFSIPINCIGKGLSIIHTGPIIMSEYARIGDNCRIHVGVNIGADARVPYKAPHLGNNIYIAPGVKMFGDITIADGIAIGANAVVNKSFLIPNISIGGIPAAEISKRGSEGIIKTL